MYESGPSKQEVGVLQYATPSQRSQWIPPPTWLNWSVGVLGLLILFLFLLGLPPLAGAVDYTRQISLSEILAYAWTKGFRGTLGTPYVVGTAVFAPLALMGLVAFLCLRGVWPQRIVLVLNVSLPAFWLAFYLPILMLVGPPLLVSAILGQCDGETWSEGFICWAAVGTWSTLWLAVTIVLFVVRRRKVAHSRTQQWQATDTSATV